MRRRAKPAKTRPETKRPRSRKALTANDGKVRDLEKRLAEALEQQAATAEILNVISHSPADLHPVLEAVAKNASRLCGAANVSLYRIEGDVVRKVAEHGEPLTALRVGETRPLTRTSVSGRAIVDRKTIFVADHQSAEAAEQYPDARRDTGIRTTIGIPLVRDGLAIGAFTAYRTESREFSDREIALLQSFADQAVIAIENVRLFTELQASNRAVTEALEQQTATAEILGVISSSPTDVQPVFETMVASCKRLLGARSAAVLRLVDQQLHLVAFTPTSPEADEEIRRFYPTPLDASAVVATVARDRAPFIVNDTDTDARLQSSSREVARSRGYRSMLVVPMLRRGETIGTVSVSGETPGSFSEKDVALLQTFADQAVIAIENVRLFRELEQKNRALTEALDRQTASAEILGAISQSQTDVQPVFDTIATNAARLCAATDAVIFRVDAGLVHVAAVRGPAAGSDLLNQIYPRPLAEIAAGQDVGRVWRTGTVFQLPDIEHDADATPGTREIARRFGHRSLLVVPMTRGEEIIGSIIVARRQVGRFDQNHIELVKTFAAQAVIAIENARLVTELQDRTSQLQVANRHKDEFLANMSHELRTPLNAVIGFSDVLLEEMFGEVNDKQTEYLRDILASGKHLLSLINDILDLSKIEAGRMELDLSDFDVPTAVENALTLMRERASRHEITLSRVIEGVCEIRADERKFKQVLLNLLSNAVKFTPAGGSVEVRAGLRDGFVEVAVTDTGEGIAAHDQQAVFEEFRQVGTSSKKVEGTGLGLALCRKFVELHGGTITLESQVGIGSTFTFTIPVRSTGTLR